MTKFSIISTKGGVGKTTLTANLAALFADLGLRVLMIDADVQPSLSKFFPIADGERSGGLTDVILCGEIKTNAIWSTVYGNLDIVLSDDPQGNLPHWNRATDSIDTVEGDTLTRAARYTLALARELDTQP